MKHTFAHLSVSRRAGYTVLVVVSVFCVALTWSLNQTQAQAQSAEKGDGTPAAKKQSTVADAKKSKAMFEEQIKKLTPIQRRVTQESGTEPPFRNEFWDNHREGLYVDIVSGKPLFSSLDKFDSGCGWPSFSKPLASDEVKENVDKTHGMVRTEVRSATADSHLGHVFDDGPKELGGLRYCINSASLRFIPKEDLEKSGYGEYAKLFAKADAAAAKADAKAATPAPEKEAAK